MVAAGTAWEGTAHGFSGWRVAFLQALRCSRSYLQPLSRGPVEQLQGGSSRCEEAEGLTVPLSVSQGGGCALMTRSSKFEQIVRGMNSVSQSSCQQRGRSWWSQPLPQPGLAPPCLQVLDVPLTVKIRTGVQEKINVAHKIIPKIREWGASMVTVGDAAVA